MPQEGFASRPGNGSELHSTAAPPPRARVVWRVISGAASVSLVVGAVVYGIALGGGGPLTSPVSIAAAAPLASVPNAVVTPERSPQDAGPDRGRGGGGHGRR